MLLPRSALADRYGVAGCLSPPTLTRAVVSYHSAITESISKQLLINIARAHHHQPVHFTGVSNVAATFDFRVSAGATPALTGDNGKALLPVFGGSVSENPTISIAPIEGEDFTRRLLTPFQETKFTLLLRQGGDIDLLLRLMAKELRLNNHGEDVAYRNSPTDKAGYEMFRKAVLHISAIQDANRLYAESLLFERTWTIPGDSVKLRAFYQTLIKLRRISPALIEAGFQVLLAEENVLAYLRDTEESRSLSLVIVVLLKDRRVRCR